MINTLLRFLDKLSAKLKPHEPTLGKATLGFSLIIGALGFPVQIYVNWVEKICGINILILLAALLMFVFRIPYLTSTKTYFLLPTELIGITTTIIMVVQWWIYR